MNKDIYNCNELSMSGHVGYRQIHKTFAHFSLASRGPRGNQPVTDCMCTTAINISVGGAEKDGHENAGHVSGVCLSCYSLRFHVRHFQSTLSVNKQAL